MLTLPIVEALQVTPRAHVLKLGLQGYSFPFRAGQAAFVQPAGAPKRRPYSIASAPEEAIRDGLLEFLVQTDLDGASGLTPDLITPGTLATVDGPLGSFVFPDHPVERRFLFIAGGTGIAPLRSMLWHTLLAERDGHVGLIYSVRSPEEFAYRDEFDRLYEQGQIAFCHTVTRAVSGGWTGRLGRIDADTLRQMIEPGETLCFVCGPPALVGDIRPQLKELGVREDQIRIEQWA